MSKNTGPGLDLERSNSGDKTVRRCDREKSKEADVEQSCLLVVNNYARSVYFLIRLTGIPSLAGSLPDPAAISAPLCLWKVPRNQKTSALGCAVAELGEIRTKDAKQKTKAGRMYIF
jgi:hypothetical protein